MTNTLKHRQEKIQARRKQTPWRQFVMELGSRLGMTYHKTQGMTSIYPQSERVGTIKKFEDFISEAESIDASYTGDFFETFQKLYIASGPNAIIDYGGNENCEYADTVINCKNVYLGNTAIDGCENVLYSFSVKENCSYVVDSFLVWSNSEIVYRSSNIFKSSKIFYSHGIINSYNCYFSNNLVGCTNCFQCNELENQEYCIENKQYSKDERYLEVSKRMRKKSDLEHKYHTFQKNNGFLINCKSVIGDNCFDSEHCANTYNCIGVKQGRNLFAIGGVSENTLVYDYFNGGSQGNDHIYGAISAGLGSSHLYCSMNIGSCSNTYYSYQLVNCSYCLGCIGLRNKSYCIFNKQYTKEERHQKVDEIFSQMEQQGTLGQFFPGSMNPFYFNDTAAYLIDDSFTKEEVTAAGYLRRDEEIKVDIPDWMDVVEVKDLGDYESRETIELPLNKGEEKGDYSVTDKKRTINPSILKKVIRDEHGNIYRVIKMEYDFLVKHGLPLPRKHWLERLKGHFKIQN